MGSVPYKRIITTVAWVALALSVSIIASILANLTNFQGVNPAIESVSGGVQGGLAYVGGVPGLF